MTDQEFQGWLITSLQDMQDRWGNELDRSLAYEDRILVLQADNETLREQLDEKD